MAVGNIYRINSISITELYFISSSSFPISLKSSSILSRCSFSCEAIYDVRSIERCGGTPGGTKAFVNTPASNSLRQNTSVLSNTPRITGTIAVFPSRTLLIITHYGLVQYIFKKSCAFPKCCAMTCAMSG